MPKFNKVYTIDIAESEHDYLATIISYKENKGMSITAPSMRLMLAEINKQIKKRSNFLRRFPIPERRAVLTIEEALVKPSRLIIHPNGS